jgi:hypothetical protein
VEAVVRAGPGPGADGESRLEPFLAAMTKLQAALEYFEKNNPQSVELENVVCCCLHIRIASTVLSSILTNKFMQRRL